MRQAFAAGQRTEVLFLLSVGAEGHDGPAAQGGVSGDDDGGGGADLCQLFDFKNVGKLVDAAAAQLFGDGQTHHAHLGKLFDGLNGEALGLVDLFCKGLYLVLGKLLEGSLKGFMLCIKFKHNISFPFFL